MGSDLLETIRKRAYALWEGEGRPEGRHEEHWHQAAREAGGSENAQGGGADAGGQPVAATVSGGGVTGFAGTQAGSTSAPANPPGGAGGGAAPMSPPAGASGISSGLQPGGRFPGGGAPTTQGSVGTGGGSTGNQPSGTAAKGR